jgi:hypothetical protein
MYFFLKGLYCSVSLYNKQGMNNCTVYQLKKLWFTFVSRAGELYYENRKNGEGSENILHNGKNTATGGYGKT